MRASEVPCILDLPGIYGIGGFLAVSRELRVLWSPPYMSRLWCVARLRFMGRRFVLIETLARHPSSQLPNSTEVFEIAAFRKANPLGKLVFQPLFIERDVLANWLGTYLLVSTLILFIAIGAGRSSTAPRIIFLGICCFGLLPAVHYVRKGYSEPRECFATSSLGLQDSSMS